MHFKYQIIASDDQEFRKAQVEKIIRITEERKRIQLEAQSRAVECNNLNRDDSNYKQPNGFVLKELLYSSKSTY